MTFLISFTVPETEEWIGTETYAALSATLVPTYTRSPFFHTGHTRCADVLRHGQRDLIGRRHHARFGVRRVLMVRHIARRRACGTGASEKTGSIFIPSFFLSAFSSFNPAISGHFFINHQLFTFESS